MLLCSTINIESLKNDAPILRIDSCQPPPPSFCLSKWSHQKVYQLVRRCHPVQESPPHKRFVVGCSSPFMRLAQHLKALRAWCKQGCLVGKKSDALRPGILVMRGSMTIRLQPCMTMGTTSLPPSLPIPSAYFAGRPGAARPPPPRSRRFGEGDGVHDAHGRRTERPRDVSAHLQRERPARRRCRHQRRGGRGQGLRHQWKGRSVRRSVGPYHG